MRARRQHDERYAEPDQRADRDFEYAIDRRGDRIDMRHQRHQQHDDRRDGRGVEPGPHRGDQRHRQDRQRQHGQQRPFACMRNEDCEQAAIERAAERADQIIAGGFQ